MKKLVAGVLMSGLMLGAIQAQAATNVYSANVVGYLNVTLPPGGKYILIGSPLDSITNAGPRTLQDVFGPSCGLRQSDTRTQVDRVFVWNLASQQYIILGQKTNGQFALVANNTVWATPTNPVIPRGYGLFVQSLASSTTGSVLTLSGQVPVGLTTALDVAGAPTSSPYQMLVNPYPVSMTLDSLINTNNGAFGSSSRTMCDRLYLWNTNSQQYLVFGLQTPTNRWYFPANNGLWNTNDMPVYSVDPGQAFFYQGKATNFTWTVDRPYNFP